MNKEDYYFLGKIIKTSGYKGNLMFFFDVDDISRYKNLEAVFIEVSENLIPFAIEKIQFRSNNTAIVKLEDVLSEDESAILVGCNLYLPLAFLPPLTGNKFYFHEVIGFSVVDKKYGKIGTILEILDRTSQAVFVIRNNGKEILIPVSDDIIKKVDRINKTIKVETPEGLIDIYM